MKVNVVKSVCKDAQKLPTYHKNKVDEQIEILSHRKDTYKKHNLPWKK